MLDAAETHADFHPRFDAIAKTYQYTIHRAPICSPFEWRYVHHYPYPLDEAAMMCGRGSSKASTISPRSPPRTIATKKANRMCARSSAHGWRGLADRLIYTVRGSGFLKHMVRNIVGTLIEAGRGNLDARAIEAFLTPDARGKAGPTAPAKGLTLMSVEYPDQAL